MSLFKRILTTGLAALAPSLPVAAQAPQPPAAPAQPQGYSSAFEGYKPFEAREVQDWRKANDTVREIGGWRAYAREIEAGNKAAAAQQGQQPHTPAAGSTPAQGQPKAADPHAGHGK